MRKKISIKTLGGRFMKKIMSALVASAVVLATSSGVAHAGVGQMVNIDIQGGFFPSSKHGPILTNGFDRYTTYADPTSGTYDDTVVEATGTRTDGTITYGLDAMTAINPGDPIHPLSSAMGSGEFKKLFDGYMNSDLGDTISLRGLDANKKYQLVVYAQKEKGETTSLFINSSQVINNFSNLSSLTQATAGNALNGNYALINTGLTSTAAGVLNFTYQGQINGFQVKELPVPEPASVVLLGIGGLLGSYRLRRSREQAAA
jgi:hypothetical protein